MKRIYEMVKPFFSIIFGALLVLVYINSLMGNGAVLAFGIIGFILGLFYIGKGVVFVLAGDKLSSNVKVGLEVTGVCLYPLFIAAGLLRLFITANNVLGPTSWVIYILGLAASLIFACAYAGSRFTDNAALKKVATLFGLSFGVYLVLDTLFDVNGLVVAIGDISVVHLIIIALYIYMMIEGIVTDPRFEFAPKKALSEPEALEEAADEPEEPKEEDSEEPKKDEPEEPNPEEEPKEE